MAKTVRSRIKYRKKSILVNGYEKDHVYRSIVRHGTFYERGMLEAISRHLEGNKGVIVDGGANIGNHTLYFAMFCPSTKVIAYEPYEPITKMLVKNISDNKLSSKVIVRPVGLYSEETHLKLSFFNEGNHGATEFVKSATPTANKAVALDYDCRGHNVSCIKLDIQGLELHALHGAKNILRKQSPLLVIEAMTEKEYGTIKNYVNRFGYKVAPASKSREYYNSSPTYIFRKE